MRCFDFVTVQLFLRLSESVLPFQDLLPLIGIQIRGYPEEKEEYPFLTFNLFVEGLDNPPLVIRAGFRQNGGYWTDLVPIKQKLRNVKTFIQITKTW